MASEQEHHVFVDGSARPVATLGPHAVAVWLQVDLRPRARHKVIAVEVVPVVAVVAAEDVHGILVNDRGVRVAWRGWGPSCNVITETYKHKAPPATSCSPR